MPNMDELMYRPSFDYIKIKNEIETQNKNIEVVKISYIDMPSYDQQKFLILEWMNEHEYVIRMYYRHLLPSKENGGMQLMGRGSGQYLQLFNYEGDAGQAEREHIAERERSIR